MPDMHRLPGVRKLQTVHFNEQVMPLLSLDPLNIRISTHSFLFLMLLLPACGEVNVFLPWAQSDANGMLPFSSTAGLSW